MREMLPNWLYKKSWNPPKNTSLWQKDRQVFSPRSSYIPCLLFCNTYSFVLSFLLHPHPKTQTSVANRSNVARSEMMKSTNVAKPSELVTNLTKTCDMLKSPHLTNPSAMKSPRSRANSCDGDSGYGDKGKHPGVSTIRRQYMVSLSLFSEKWIKL